MLDRRPPGNRSPYEFIGQGGKMQKPAEMRAESVKGCGRPGCSVCMPTGRPQDAGAVKPSGGSGFGNPFGALSRQVLEELARQMGGAAAPSDPAVFNVQIGGQDFRATEFRTEPARLDREKAVADERRLRPTVERFFLKAKHDMAWDDVVGNKAAHAALMEAIEHPVRHKAIYAHYGMRPTKGVLLYGPPGCGKTMFGKAAASVLAKLHGGGPARATLLHINGPEIQSPYVGVTEETIRSIFAYARAYKALHGAPLVVFIDEADSILPSRSGGDGNRRALPWEESQVATFLTEMDGLEDSGAFVILATNRPTTIDEAVLRDGRCDRKIKVERPDQEAAATILLGALAGVPISADEVWDGGPLGRRGSLAAAAAEDLFDPFRRLARLDHGAGPDFLTMGDVVNGAMLVSLVEQAKAGAFRRDVAAGGPPSGLNRADLAAAVDAVTEQNRVLRHGDALDEVAARIEGQVSVTQITAAFRRAT